MYILYIKLRPKREKVTRTKCFFFFQFHILCENFSKIGPLIKINSNFETSAPLIKISTPGMGICYLFIDILNNINKFFHKRNLNYSYR